MRILVVGAAAYGVVGVADRVTRPITDDAGLVLVEGSPRHLVSVLADQDMWERPPVVNEQGEVLDPGLPLDVFTCTTLDQAARYLRALVFDVVFADGRLGAAAVRWIAAHRDELPQIPRLRLIGPMDTAGLEGLDARPVRAVTAAGVRAALTG